MTDLPELLEEIDEPFGPVPTAVGAGTTLAGIATGLRPGQRAIGVSVLRGARSLDEVVVATHRTTGSGGVLLECMMSALQT